MNLIFHRKLWVTTLAILALGLLSACGALSIQVVTPTAMLVTQPANTSTPVTPLPTQTTALTETPTVAVTPTTTTESAPTVTGAVTIEKIKMKDANTGWAIGKLTSGTSDLIFTTQDGGKTWTDITPPHAFDVIGADNKSAIAYFSDSGNAWVFYYNKDTSPLSATSAMTWNTSDGGQTWKSSQTLDLAKIQMAFFNPSDISFSDNQHGWMMIHLDAGMMHDYVTIFATSDGGGTWKEIVDPTGQSLPQSCYKSGMVFLDANTGWVAGDCGGVQAGVYFYKTTDGGETWTSQALPAPATVPNAFTDQNDACGSFPPQFIDAKTGFISVKCTNLSGATPVTTTWPYLTSDGGTTWTALPALSDPLGKLFFLDGQTGWFLGASSTDVSLASYAIYQTSDGGKTWKQLTKLSWSGQMDFISNKAGWVVASDGNNLALVQTTNGGVTWQEIKPVVVTR
jgi:photosystem II stability/assembly factor-like uncharacterized protein